MFVLVLARKQSFGFFLAHPLKQVGLSEVSGLENSSWWTFSAFQKTHYST